MFPALSVTLAHKLASCLISYNLPSTASVQEVPPSREYSNFTISSFSFLFILKETTLFFSPDEISFPEASVNLGDFGFSVST